MYQFVEYMIPDFSRELATEQNVTNGMEHVNISLSLLVNFPCHFLHIDSIDSLGFSQLYANTVSRRRYTESGDFIGILDNVTNKRANRKPLNIKKLYNNRTKDDKKLLKKNLNSKHDLHATQFDEVNEINEQNETNKCYKCYEVKDENECCNSCEEVVMLHMINGLKVETNKWEQCKNFSMDNFMKEKCLFQGKLTVNKVPGNFHIGIGENKEKYGMHRHNLNITDLPFLNMTHVIGRIRFGLVLPTASLPLKGFTITQKVNKTTAFEYSIICTPLVLMSNNEIIAKSFEYTGMLNNYVVDETLNDKMPGIYFNYRFTPYSVIINVKMEPAFRFITSTFCVLAGLFSIASLLDAFIFKKQTEKERNVVQIEGQ